MIFYHFIVIAIITFPFFSAKPEKQKQKIEIFSVVYIWTHIFKFSATEASPFNPGLDVPGAAVSASVEPLPDRRFRSGRKSAVHPQVSNLPRYIHPLQLPPPSMPFLRYLRPGYFQRRFNPIDGVRSPGDVDGGSSETESDHRGSGATPCFRMLSDVASKPGLDVAGDVAEVNIYSLNFTNSLSARAETVDEIERRGCSTRRLSASPCSRRFPRLELSQGTLRRDASVFLLYCTVPSYHRRYKLKSIRESCTV